MKSLRFKIFLAIGLPVVAAVVALGVAGRGVTRSGVHRIVELEERRTDRALVETLRRELEEGLAESRVRGGDVDLSVAPRIFAAFDEVSGGAVGAALFDARGELVAGVGLPPGKVTARPLGAAQGAVGVEAHWRVDEEGRFETVALQGGLPVRAPDGRTVGTLLPLPRPSSERAANRRETLVRIDRRLLVVASGVGVLALVLGALLARRIVHPVEALADAARDLGAGDLARRVQAVSGDELGRLGRAFNEMAEALERSEGLRRRLVADMAHELRTPLAALRAQLEALQDGVVQPTDATVESLVEDAVHLSGLVDDLQDLALADAGCLTLECRSLDLEREILAAARSLGIDCGARSGSEQGGGLRLELPDAGDLPPVHADPVRLRQILHNLMDNALRHGGSGTPERPIEIGVRTADAEHVATSSPSDRPPSTIRLTVRDHGPGIAPQHLPRLFERLHRADPSRTRATGGTGLGLAITKTLVDLHGGSVDAENAPGDGLVVTLTLPVSRPADSCSD